MGANKTSTRPSNSKPEKEEKMDIHSMIHINCKYRGRIRGLLKHSKDLNKTRKDLEEKYSKMRKEVFNLK